MPEIPTTVTRAFELPIQQVVTADGSNGWDLLWECWRNSTDLANWCVQQLLHHEPPIPLGAQKLPERPVLNGQRLKGLYGLASEMLLPKEPDSWWRKAATSISTICRDVENYYLRERAAVLLQRTRAPRLYTYPYPWPVHAQGWRAAWLDSSGKPWVRLTLPGGQVEMRLRGGPEFGRQMGLFRQVVNGNLPRRQLIIRRQRCSPSCHRPNQDRARGNWRALLKLVADLPVRECSGGRVLTLTTDPAAFWVAELDGRPAWVLNNDHFQWVFTWLTEHSARLQRLAQDRKAERRLAPQKLQQLQNALERACHKHRKRVSSWLKESVDHLMGFCLRQKVGEIAYDDNRRDFIPTFPWAQLRTLLADAAKERSIVLHTVDGDLPAPAVPADEEGDG